MEFTFTDHPSRRIFIKGLGFVSLGVILGAVGGCDLDALIDAIANRPMRRRLRTGSAEVDADIATYRQAVTLMKGLGSGDLRHWEQQAATHGTNGVGFLWCEHGTNHFFDWHRAYLFHFEKICQKLTGNAKFGLPYWNWNQNPGIHSAFLDTSSVLFMTRTNTSMSGRPSVGTPQLDIIFGDSNFFSFSQQIEGTPHNNVHGFIGNSLSLGGFGSARDPLFWMHHCMIDYCWTKWNLELENDNTNDSAWLGTNHEHFSDADGNPTSTTTNTTLLMPLLSYQYESSAIGSNSTTAAITTKSAFDRLERRIRAGASIRFDIKQRFAIAEKAAVSIARPMSRELKLSPSDFGAIINSREASERIFVSVEYASLPTASDFTVRVFVNLPAATAQTPTDDPHYAGSFAFFGTQLTGPEARPQPAPRFLVNITPTLQRLRSTQALRETEPLSIQLVPVPFAGKFERPDTQLQLNRVEILVTPVVVRSR